LGASPIARPPRQWERASYRKILALTTGQQRRAAYLRCSVSASKKVSILLASRHSTRMHIPPFASLDAFQAGGMHALRQGPVALLLVEDTAEVAATLDHLAHCGFRRTIAFLPEDIALPAHPTEPVRVTMNTRRPDALADAVNAALSAAPPGIWLHACYNAEFLMFPFSEHRSVGELLAFHAEEKRDAMLTFVIDLYAADLSQAPNGIDRAAPHFDRLGYYALSRLNPARHNHPNDRQLDFFGGLRWRFEEHVDDTSRRIDRVSLFRARPQLRMSPDNTFNAPEYNTYACQWHNNLTATLCSFRAAKALLTNPLSREAIQTFLWQGSEPFNWSSRQLMDLGLMEPGQWF
ncbi:MAG: hypothetical protein AAGB05_13160, partial [Pseudomonadota bacterium]